MYLCYVSKRKQPATMIRQASMLLKKRRGLGRETSTFLPRCELLIWFSPDAVLHLLPLSPIPISSRLFDMPAASYYMSETMAVTQQVTTLLTSYVAVTILVCD